MLENWSSKDVQADPVGFRRAQEKERTREQRERQEAQDALFVAQKDVVGKGDAGFRTAVLAGALARGLAAQEERIRELEKELAKPKRQSRTKAKTGKEK
jgi:hypothetical protein